MVAGTVHCGEGQSVSRSWGKGRSLRGWEGATWVPHQSELNSRREGLPMNMDSSPVTVPGDGLIFGNRPSSRQSCPDRWRSCRSSLAVSDGGRELAWDPALTTCSSKEISCFSLLVPSAVLAAEHTGSPQPRRVTPGHGHGLSCPVVLGTTGSPGLRSRRRCGNGCIYSLAATSPSSPSDGKT